MITTPGMAAVDSIGPASPYFRQLKQPSDRPLQALIRAPNGLTLPNGTGQEDRISRSYRIPCPKALLDTYRMDLAFRTGARLEPHAPPGYALVEERFWEFGLEDPCYLERGYEGVAAANRSTVKGLRYDNITENLGVKKCD